MDVTQINSQLWTGAGVNSAIDVQQIIADGIGADLDCRILDDASFITQVVTSGYPYLYDPTEDDGQPKPVAWFATAWSWSLPLLQKGTVILCHCDAGVNRGPSQAYFHLRAFWKMTGDDAFALLRAKRPIVQVAYRTYADQAITALGLG
jgi:protein-tyrosine phosphatase